MPPHLPHPSVATWPAYGAFDSRIASVSVPSVAARVDLRYAVLSSFVKSGSRSSDLQVQSYIVV